MSADDLSPVVEQLKMLLVGKNVALEIAEQVCQSVASELAGTKMSNFSRTKTIVRQVLSNSPVGTTHFLWCAELSEVFLSKESFCCCVWRVLVSVLSPCYVYCVCCRETNVHGDCTDTNARRTRRFRTKTHWPSQHEAQEDNKHRDTDTTHVHTRTRKHTDLPHPITV